MNKDKTTKEHYVPQLYLERFSNPSPTGKKKKIWIFDKITQKHSYSSDIGDTATHRYFYDFPIELFGEDNKKVFDIYLQKLESMIAPFYEKSERRLSCILRLNDKQKYQGKAIRKIEKKEWSFVLAVQALRTPELRNLLKEVKQKSGDIRQSFLEQLSHQKIKQMKANFPELNSFSNKDIKEYLIEKTSEEDDNLYISTNLPAPHYDFFNRHIYILSRTFLKHKWIIGINQTNIPFYISDNPVAKIPYTQTGYDSEGIEVLFPINPNLILILRGKKHPRSHEGDCKLMSLSEEEVIKYNKAQVYCSSRFIYCQEDKFELAKEICKEEPDSCSIVKDRVKFIKQ